MNWPSLVVTITGTVTDSTGGVLPGVTVTATHTATGNTFFSVTDERGLFRIPARIVSKNTLIVPESLPLEHAALTEPLACVVRGLEETGISRPTGSTALRLSGRDVLTVPVSDEGALGAVFDRLRAENISVHGLSLHLPSLDEVFLTPTGRKTEGSEENAA